MKAVVLRAFGGPDELVLAEVPDPVAGPGEVLVAVWAAGTNPVDAFNRQDGTWADGPS
jgi:NADPH:quinone reductase